MGLFSSSSKSSTTNQTYNTDARVATESGIGVSGDSNVIQVTDGGIVSRSLQTVDVNNATNAVGFQSLLDAASDLFNRGENLIGQTQSAVADAYGQAQTNKAGSIDNRTIIVLALAGAAALYAINRK